MLFRQLSIGAIAFLLGVFFIMPMLAYLSVSLGFSSYTAISSAGNAYFTTMVVYLFMPLPFVALFAMGCAWHFSSKIHREQQKITLLLLKEIDPTLHFNHKIMEPRKLMQSGFFNRGDKKNKVYPMNYGVIEGEIDSVPVEFADLNVMEAKLRWWQIMPMVGTMIMLTWYFFTNLTNLFGKRRDIFLYGFKGLFFIAEFNKKIHGVTMVLPDSYEKHIGFLAPAVQDLMKRKQGKLAYLEDPRFEKEFVVYTTDQVEARYILSTSFMERAVELKQKLGRPLLLSFSKNQIYVAILDHEGIFQVPLRKNVLTPKAIEKPYNDLVACTEIVKNLKLNQKLW